MFTKIGYGILFLLILIESYNIGINTALDGEENFSFAALTSNTEYSDGYSDLGYLSVKIGDEEKQVIDKIGKPFNCYTSKEDTNICIYGRSNRDAYRCRWIEYDKKNTVIKKCNGVVPD